METRKIVVRVGQKDLDAGQLKAELVKLTGAPEASIANIRQAVSNTHVFIVRVAAEHFGLFLAKNGGKIRGQPVEIKTENSGGDERPVQQEERPDQAALAAANAAAGGDKKVGENGLAGQLADLGIERATLPPGPAPQPKREEPKREERPPSLGKARMEAAFRGMKAGEGVLRQLLELNAKDIREKERTRDGARFILEIADELGVPAWILKLPTDDKGIEAESRSEMLTRFVYSLLNGPNPMAASALIRKAGRIHFIPDEILDQLAEQIEETIQRRLDAGKVVPLKAGGGEATTGTDGKAF